LVELLLRRPFVEAHSTGIEKSADQSNSEEVVGRVDGAGSTRYGDGLGFEKKRKKGDASEIDFFSSLKGEAPNSQCPKVIRDHRTSKMTGELT